MNPDLFILLTTTYRLSTRLNEHFAHDVYDHPTRPHGDGDASWLRSLRAPAVPQAPRTRGSLHQDANGPASAYPSLVLLS
jgi:hypothetical protein